jgi:hypothetical protein
MRPHRDRGAGFIEDVTVAVLGSAAKHVAEPPYAYLHICGSPWVGNSYSSGDEPVRTMQYVKSTY